MILSKRFRAGDVLISLEDTLLLPLLEGVYAFQRSPVNTAAGISQIGIRGFGPYEMIVDSEKVDSVLLSKDDVLLAVDGILDTFLRCIRSEHLYSIHASTSVIHGNAICFVGTSCSGKTTLSLMTSREGDGFLGDEFALLDWARGAVFHEDYPVHIKNPEVFRDYGIAWSPACILGSNGFSVHVANPRELGLPMLEGPLPIGGIVFPEFSPRCEGVTMRAVGVTEASYKIMTSISCDGRKPLALARILGMVSHYRIPLISIKHNDALAAAKRLAECFRCD